MFLVFKCYICYVMVGRKGSIEYQTKGRAIIITQKFVCELPPNMLGFIKLSKGGEGGGGGELPSFTLSPAKCMYGFVPTSLSTNQTKLGESVRPLDNKSFVWTSVYLDLLY